MPDREKVIKGLECHLGNDKNHYDCDNCQYGPMNNECDAKLVADALALLKALDVTPEELERLKKCRHECKIDCLLEHYEKIKAERDALLKAQEPRLVTIDDFKGADEYGWLPAWCEQQTGGAVYCECILADALKEKGIRYWTSRPTDEQREAIPWGQQDQREYEAAIEMAEYCERYEPTYSAEDGSM